MVLLENITLVLRMRILYYICSEPTVVNITSQFEINYLRFS